MIPKRTPPPPQVPESNATTHPPQPTGFEAAPSQGEWQGALVLIWSREEPERVGEVCLFPLTPGHCLTLGRGESTPAEPIAPFGQQRPGEYLTTGPLRARSISRRQLRLEVLSDGRLAIENVGSCPLLFEGRPLLSVIVQQGDLVELQHELLLQFTTRPATLPPMPYELVFQPFGDADALGLVGESPQLWDLRSRIAAIGPLNTHVLVLGPSGAGKELVARGLHTRSPRARKALISRSAATLPEGLITAELFGNIAHYPHHGMPERPGLIGAAHESTLLLDEFGELPHTLQTQLLRVLDQGEYQRLGETRVRSAHFRLIAATNREEGELKQDVRARFSTRILVPGLNERREDIPLLIRHLLRRHLLSTPLRPGESPPHDSPAQRLPVEPSAELVQALLRHHYRTHIRELNELLLESLLERQGSRLRVPSRLKTLTSTGISSQALATLSPGQGATGRGGNPAGTPGQPGSVSSPQLEGSSPPLEGLTPGPSALYSREELQRLQLFQRFEYRIGELVASGEYPANRQTADLHLRQLMTRALLMTEGDVSQAVLQMGERSTEASRGRLRARMTTWRDNLRERQRSPEHQGAEGRARLEKALHTEYRGFREILDLLNRLEAWEKATR